MRTRIQTDSIKERMVSMLLFLLGVLSFLCATQSVSAQRSGVSTNLLYWATTTPNLSIEFHLSSHLTAGATLGYNPFNLPNRTGSAEVYQNPKLRHMLVSPTVKYWFCRTWEQHFIGISGIYLDFNVGGLRWPSFLDGHRYAGNAYGGSLDYGYQWAIGRRWGLEASVGAGYLYMDYSKYRCGACGKKEKQARRHYIGPVKAAVSLIYYLE